MASRAQSGRTLLGLIALALLGALTLAPSAPAATGDLTQKSPTAGCIADQGSPGGCVDGEALDGATSVAVSPDGKHAYVAASSSSAVSTFDRNSSTGALSQKACVSATGVGLCIPGSDLEGARSVTTSSDGNNAYVIAPAAGSPFPGVLTTLGRDPTTGILTQIDVTVNLVDGTSVALSPDDRNIYVAASPYNVIFELNRDTGTGEVVDGSFSCIAESPSPPFCTEGAALDGATSVAVSPDGKHVYVASRESDAIAIFSRDTSSGELTSAGFTKPAALNAPQSVTVSPDGKSVYAAAQLGDAVVVFDRNTTTGALAQKGGAAGCISDTGAGGCADGEGLNGAYSVTVAPDNQSVYVGSRVSDAVALFDRNTTTGALAQKPGTSGCISSNAGLAGVCDPGIGLDSIRSVTVSPDGKNLYTAATVSDAVAVFDREAPPPPAPDTAVDGSATAKKTQKQKGKKIIVKAKAKAGEDLEAKAKGKVKVKKKSYKLKPVTKSVSSGNSKNLKLKPKKSRDARKIAKALKQGKKATAKLTVKLTDEAANEKAEKLSVKLKR